MLPNTGNKLNVAICANGTSKQFLLHDHTAMHVCKQIGLDTKEANAMMALEAAQCELNATKAEYAKLARTTKKNTKLQKEKDENQASNVQKKAKELKEKGENPAPDINIDASILAAAKKACKEATKKMEEAKLVVATAGAKLFKLYGNLLSDKARQPWEK